MGTFDDLFCKAMDLAKAAGSKTEEVMGVAKMKMQAAQLKSDIDANYTKLGEIVYELTKAGAQNQELIDMCIAEISDQLSELDELNNRMDDMRNLVKCPACVAANPMDAAFCARCGASLHPVTADEPQEQPVDQQPTEQPAPAQPEE